jgi:hypothetical protein
VLQALLYLELLQHGKLGELRVGARVALLQIVRAAAGAVSLHIQKQPVLVKCDNSCLNCSHGG